MNTQAVIAAAVVVLAWIFKDLISAMATRLLPDLIAVAVGKKKLREISLYGPERTAPFEIGRQEAVFFRRTIALDADRTRQWLMAEICKARRTSLALSWVLTDVEMVSAGFAQAFKDVLIHVAEKNNISLTVIFPQTGMCPVLDDLKISVGARIEAVGASCIVLRTDGERLLSGHNADTISCANKP